ncbi:hypothetical protein BB560_004557 [Smittium megazygosporum]|uniref:YABBY protein C-terminal domain-containing protein n=1 Tax=Smittium megazygosporum TaxID=133381 RepID=A0A2T9Z8Y5_9FUNG|nr:hypothetical protein BB560_004557 [Smittium megazygosporum]
MDIIYSSQSVLRTFYSLVLSSNFPPFSPISIMPPRKTGRSRKQSSYNIFMKTEIAKVKVGNPTLSHKDAFKMAASNWKNSPANPINAKTAKVQ